jgi:RHS repeat-associated protein
MDLDIYGKVRTFEGRSLSECPFRYQGQYQDEETGLYYNRFRYYDPDEGMYISQDPIGLEGNNPTLYGYVIDVNSWVDILGFSSMDPDDIHLSHDAKASTPFSLPKHGTVQDLADALIEDEIRISQEITKNPNVVREQLNPLAERIPEIEIEIEIAKINGKTYSANNRRLKAFQIANKRLKVLGFSIRIRTTRASKAQERKIRERMNGNGKH